MVFVSNSFRKSSFNDFLDVVAATKVDETPVGAYQVALLVQLPRDLIHPWPELKLCIREAVHKKKSQSYVHFPYGGGRGAQPHSIASGGVFPHFKGDSNTTKLTTKRQILAQNNQFNDKTPP